MDNALWAVVSAITGVVVGLFIAGVRSYLHRRSVKSRWSHIQQQIVKDYGEAMAHVVSAKNSGDSTQIILAQTRMLALATQGYLVSLFLDAEGVLDVEVELPEIPWAADSDTG